MLSVDNCFKLIIKYKVEIQHKQNKGATETEQSIFPRRIHLKSKHSTEKFRSEKQFFFSNNRLIKCAGKKLSFRQFNVELVYYR